MLFCFEAKQNASVSLQREKNFASARLYLVFTSNEKERRTLPLSYSVYQSYGQVLKLA
jgi:hypothetical protein